MKSVAITIAMLAALPASALAQEAEGTPRETFKERAERSFGRMDSDANGSVDMAEVQAFMEAGEQRRAERTGSDVREVNPKRVERYLANRDANANGTIEQTEYVEERLGFFDERDTNGDGILTREERTTRN